MTGKKGLLANPVNPSDRLDAVRSVEKLDRYQLQAHKGLNWAKPFKGRAAWAKHISDIEEMI